MASPPHPVGRYRPIATIASGGMATVYLGALEEAGTETKLVALKRVHPDVARDPLATKMLIHEIFLASSIQHPNIVSVLDADEQNGGLVIVMDYVEGASLAQLVSASEDVPLPPEVAVQLVVDAAAGLQFLHQFRGPNGEAMGIVHRDISPSNILVGLDGRGRLTDFGIARTAISPQRTATGVLRGKPSYMAPEYVESGVVSASGDVFALGVIAWELLARRRLFLGKNQVETLVNVRNAVVPPLASIDPKLAPFDGVLRRALSRNPAVRYADSESFGAALAIAAKIAAVRGNHDDVARHLDAVFGDTLRARADVVRIALGARTTKLSSLPEIAVREDEDSSLLELAPPQPPPQPAPPRHVPKAPAESFRTIVMAFVVSFALAFGILAIVATHG